ncbi:9208_t:CDS:2 [Acaulospora morrowiae]|uniref:9208_t:CDS:1 n=1 Tax=Acaulospora morrowiae TaxID=94023 RepID=A0A9N9AMH2_9GLOM|nr:9208_t:CDS:2 [Acaulospora morrowiae]
MGATTKIFCPICDKCLDTKLWCQECEAQRFRENFDNWTSNFKEIDDFIKFTQLNAKDCTDYLEWISFNSFIGVSKYDVSEVGTVYTANWKKGPKDAWDEVERRYAARRELVKVALISLGKAPAAFLKELKLHYNFRLRNGLVIRLFGVTRESVTGNLMMVAETCEWDLRHYVSHHYARLTWSKKLAILHTIACALESVHNGEQVHRDYTINGQIFKSHLEIPVNELGLGDSKDPIPIIGYYKNDLLPYMAPEILRGEQPSLKSDIYSFGILMWELSTNKPPFYDRPSNTKLIDSIRRHGLRPTIGVDTPDCYIELMKRCWSSNPNERPSASELTEKFGQWHLYKQNIDQFSTAERIRVRHLKEKGIDTNPGKMVAPPKVHPQAIYTSRKLKFPVLPLTGARSQRIRQSLNDKSAIDFSTLLVKDESYFVKNGLLNQRQLEEEDDDLIKQYEMSIPFDPLPSDIMAS